MEAINYILYFTPCIGIALVIMASFELAVVALCSGGLWFSLSNAIKPDSSPIWWISVVILILLIIILLIDSLRRILRRNRIKRQIGLYIQEFDELRRRCLNQQSLPPEQEVINLGGRIGTYLENNLGGDFKTRFVNSSGLTHLTYLSGDHARIETFCSHRITRLQQILSDLTK